MTTTEDALTDSRTLGERLSDRIAAFGGSWLFVTIFLAFLLAWTLLNTEILGPRREAFDPYPYVFLNLMLSTLAAIQAPIILMAQNRQVERDRRQAEVDYRINLKAELEIQALHQKMDGLREAQWAELVRLQHVQIAHLECLVETLVREAS